MKRHMWCEEVLQSSLIVTRFSRTLVDLSGLPDSVARRHCRRI